MDILATKGEFSPSDLAELQGMTQPELVAFTIGLSKGWYQLLESLEQAHRQDLEQLQTRLDERFQAALRATTASHTAQLTALKTQLSSLEKGLAGGLEREKDTSEMLKKLKNTLDKLTSESTAGR